MYNEPRIKGAFMEFDKIKELLANQLNIDKSNITESSKIVDDLGADSLDVVELLMTLEDEFGISVSDEEALEIKTVGDIAKIIEKNKK